MSYRYLAWAVEQDVHSTHAYAVLCALAGYANENGECWPSQSALAKKTKQTDRSVRNQLQSLIDTGHIQRAIVAGRYGLRIVIERNTVPVRNLVPDKNANNPEPYSQNEESDASTPERVSPPSEPVKEPVNEARKKDRKPDDVSVPDWIPEDVWEAYIDYRKVQKVGVTPYALKLAIRRLDDLRGQGQDPAAVINNAILRGWKGGLYPVKGDENGNRNTTHNAKPNGPHANLFAGFGLADLE